MQMYVNVMKRTKSDKIMHGLIYEDIHLEL